MKYHKPQEADIPLPLSNLFMQYCKSVEGKMENEIPV